MMDDRDSYDANSRGQDLMRTGDAGADAGPSEGDRKPRSSPQNGVRIKRERPDFDAEPEIQGNPSKIRIKEELRDDPPQPSGSGTFFQQKNGANSEWLFSRRLGRSPVGETMKSQSTLDTLQRMVHRFDGADGSESHRVPAMEQFNSPDRHQNLPWMDRNLSPYAYPHFSIGLTPRSSSSTDSPKPNAQSAKEYPCKKCSFMANSKKELDSHLKEEHYKVSCPNCNYIATSQGRMTRHMELAHGSGDPSDHAGTPNGEGSPNSSGEGAADHIALMGSKTLKKPKKCKVCKSVFHTKNDYYDHMSEHFPSLLKCRVPQCKFVTTLPHHMRYHTAIHTGEKMHQCPDCNYKCATTSMLKSHTKCHDTVCRYRCATCSFAAKHANALNSHLKRTGHVAGPVLSTDGSIPVDDHSSKFENHVRKKPQKCTASAPSDFPLPPLVPIDERSPENAVSYSRLPSVEPLPMSQPMTSVHTPPLNPLAPPPVSLLVPPLPPPVFSPHRYQMAQMYMHNLRYMNSMMPRAPLGFGLPTLSWASPNPGPSPSKCMLCGDSFPSKQVLMQHILSGSCQNPPSAFSSSTSSSSAVRIEPAPHTTQLRAGSCEAPRHSKPSSSAAVKKEKREEDFQDHQPLDLSLKPRNDNKTLPMEDRKEPSNRKSRRKGIAHKLDLSTIRNDHDLLDENCDNHDIPGPESAPLACDTAGSHGEQGGQRPKLPPPATHSRLPDLEPIVKQEPAQSICFTDESGHGYPCHYCQIVFKDKRMFTSHVPLHSPIDPFLCSDCRRSFLSGRDFFLHLSEYEHKLLSIQ